MTTYVRELSAGEIIRGSADLYRKNFATMFLVAILFVAPLEAVGMFVSRMDLPERVIYFVVSTFLSLIVYSAMTVAVSDACTGRKPGVLQSYRRVPRSLLSLFAAYFLMSVAILCGSILLVVPGVLFALWFFFAPVVVVIERAGAVASLKRSKALGKGFYSRNFGLGLFSSLLVLFPYFLIVALTGGILGGFFHTTSGPIIQVVAAVEATLFVSLLYPFIFTGLVLTYYDMRARKESYDSTALTEDLRR